jgi:lysozyme
MTLTIYKIRIWLIPCLLLLPNIAEGCLFSKAQEQARMGLTSVLIPGAEDILLNKLPLLKMDTKKEEGFKDKIYKDTKGNKTVGTGFNLQDPVTANMLPKEVAKGKRAITKSENDTAYNKRMALAEKDARQYLGGKVYDGLDEERKSAVNDMSYNLGLPKLLKFEKTKEAIIKGDYDKAADEILDSKYARQLPNRAKRNAETIRGKERELEKEILRQGISKR